MASSATPAQATSAPPDQQLYKINLSGDFFTWCQYERGTQLGAGLTGKVYLATHRSSPEEKKAVKIMPLRDGHIEEARVWKAFEREVKVFEKTDHIGIMKCSMAVSCPDYLAIVMKFYRKGSLRQNMSSIPSVAKPRVARCLSDAVSYLHKKRIIHGDIKIDNVLMDDGYRPVLTDFGNSRRLSEQATETSASGYGGTKSYWPPELLNGTEDSRVDPLKVDAYALGVTALTILTLIKPSRDRDYFLEASTSDKVSSDQRPVLMSLLDPEPMMRISVAKALETYNSIVYSMLPILENIINEQ